MPNENLIYVADSQFTPYGNKSEQQITDRVLTIADYLNKHHIKALVVACNTATAAAIKTLRKQYDIPIIGLEPALKPAAENTSCNRIGVLATQATLESEKYKQLKNSLNNSINIIEKASPLFVELVESTEEIGNNELILIEKELDIFKQAKVDSLVLGCTHYPFLTKSISQVMGPKVALFESGEPVAKELERRLQQHCNRSSNQGDILYFSSNPKKSQSIFNLLLNQTINLQLL